jgi:hypothetical protein
MRSTTRLWRGLQHVLAAFAIISVAVPLSAREALGPCSRKTPIVLSEVMYKPAARSDGKNLEFLEIYNSNPFFHDISGYQIEAGNLRYTFPSGTILAGGAFLVIAAAPEAVQSVYSITNVVGPYLGSLKASGTIHLYSEHGALLLTVPYSDLAPWPIGADGTGHSLVLANPTYGEEDPRAWDVSIETGGSPGAAEPGRSTVYRDLFVNELAANSGSSSLSFVEFYNHSSEPKDLAGCILTDRSGTNRFVLPAGAGIQPGGFLSFDRSQSGFVLDEGTRTIVLLYEPDGAHLIDAVQYEPQDQTISYGRWPDGATEFYPMAGSTPGSRNTAPLRGTIVINELMYDPISGNDDDQYVELYNRGTVPVDLGGWKFTDGVSFLFPTNLVLGPDSYLVVGRNVTNLLARYTNLNTSNTLGNYTGKLSHSGARIALAKPRAGTPTGSPPAQTVYVVEDEVTYGTGGRWGQWSGGGGSSLELIDPHANGRLAANWADSDESQKSAWVNIETTGVLDNGANYESSIAHAQLGLLDVGECLVDDVEVRTSSSGSTNLVTNPDFESGLGNWSLQGCFARSSLENSGYASSQALHIRCSDRLWTGVNSCQVALLKNTLGGGQSATLRFKARWLHGWPEILLRLNGNWLEAAGGMPVPLNLGTPGAPNSRYLTNAGPAIYDVTHTPALPAANQPVVVTARVHDPDGLQSLALNYRIDPSASIISVPMTDNGTGGDAVAGDGLYSATIPGQTTGTLVAFTLSAADTQTASTRFPALRNDNAPDPECVVLFGDGNPGGSFGVYHMWITQTNVNRWIRLSDLSNESHDCTFVNGTRIIYNAQGRFAGSPYHQNFNSPSGNLCHYKLTFPDDDKFLGATSFNKIHQPGNGAGDDASIQREQLANSFLRALGVPWLNRRYVAVYVNGHRRGTLMEDAQTPDGDLVKEYFPNDKDGYLFKMQPWFEFAATPAGTSIGFNNQAWCALMPFTTTGGQKKTARYRYNFLVRRTPSSANDFTNVFSLVDAANSFGTTNYVANMENLADLENWMRVFAANHAAGNWDSFGAQNAQNLYGYIGMEGTKYSLMMWDFNIVFGNSGSWGPGQNLFAVNGADPNTANLYRQPEFRRMYWRALQELINGPLDVSQSGPLLDAKFQAFAASGVNVQNPSAIKSWLTSARNSIAQQLAAENTTNFTVNTSVSFRNNLALISGRAPVAVKSVQVNGVPWPVTWTSVTGWTVAVPMDQGTNSFTVTGVDMHGQSITDATNAVVVEYFGPETSPAGHVVINEIMNQPVRPGAEFVELYNNSANITYDLSGWQLPELGYPFPNGSFLSPGGYLVLAGNRPAFAAVYGATVPVFDTFDGTLGAGTQTLSLTRPSENGAGEETVAKVKYESALPWPVPPIGAGSSLQLIDASQDISRVGNWGLVSTNLASAPQWQYVTVTGIATKSTLLIGMATAGDVYIDDLKLVAGSVPEAGTNYLTDGDFESPLTGPWTVSPNMSGSSLSTAVRHSGQSSLHIVATGGGPTIDAAIWQNTGTLVTNAIYTLSYWYLPSPNGSSLLIRLWGSSPASGEVYSLQSFQPNQFNLSEVTPGAPNSVRATLAAFPPLWLNEVQVENETGPTNRAGQHTPWLELYNPSTNVIPLSGLFLASSYSDLTEWAFPADATLSPNEFKVIFADGQTALSTAGELHTSFTLPPGSGSVALSRLNNSQPQVIDYINYTDLAPDQSFGSYPDGQGFDRRRFVTVTPGGPNQATGPALSVAINEWMASNTQTIFDPIGGAPNDWFELYNYGSQTVDLSGSYLTDDLANPTQFRIPQGYSIPPSGFLLVWADGLTGSAAGELHVNFHLKKSGTTLGLYSPDGRLVDSVSFGPQSSDVSEGRVPDGGPNIFFMAPTPGSSNAVANSAPAILDPGVQYAYPGQAFVFAIRAVDSDLPAQTITYSLDAGAPPTAAIDAVSGLFTWTPSRSDLPGTRTVSVRATDSGLPPLSGSRTVTLVLLPPLTVSVTATTGEKLLLSWPTAPGKRYRIEFTDDLGSGVWSSLGSDLPGTGNPLSYELDTSSGEDRFYRLVSVE